VLAQFLKVAGEITTKPGTVVEHAGEAGCGGLIQSVPPCQFGNAFLYVYGATRANTTALVAGTRKCYMHWFPKNALSVHMGLRILSIALVVKTYKGKTPTLSRELVLRDEDVPDLAVLLEKVLDVVGRGAVGEVVHLEGHHLGGVGRRPSRIARHFAKLLL